MMRGYEHFNKLSLWRSLLLFLQVYSAVAIAMTLAMMFQNYWLTVAAIFFIAARQHSLYILNHDASHYSLFSSRKLNKIIATLFCNAVMFHHPEAWSFVLWRRVHIEHHAHLFTAADPNYVGRQNANDVATQLQLLSSCLRSVPQSIKQFLINLKNVNWRKFSSDKEMKTERVVTLVFQGLLLAIIYYCGGFRAFLLFWILPMYTVYPIILRFHDLIEHHWTSSSRDPRLNTRSIKIGFVAKMFLSFLPRGFHREHHFYPRVPVIHLRKLSKELVAKKVCPVPTKGILNLF